MFLEIKGITKHFGDGESRVNVLKGIDMSMEKGEICSDLYILPDAQIRNQIIHLKHKSQMLSPI